MCFSYKFASNEFINPHACSCIHSFLSFFSPRSYSFHRLPTLFFFSHCPRDNHYIQRSIASVAPLETGRCDRRPGFDDLNLLDTSLKLECIKLFVAQVVMSDCEEHSYDGALQGFINVARFHESCVSIDSRGTCHEIVFHGFKFFFGIGHFPVSVSITGVRSGFPLVVERESHVGILPSLRPPSLSRSAR
jgi:hypothetical protein